MWNFSAPAAAAAAAFSAMMVTLCNRITAKWST